MSWNDPDREDTTIYKAVINHEEQYSIWPAERENPVGWSDTGKTGTKSECLAYIKEVWTDMRPLSLRKRMEEQARNPPMPDQATSNDPQPRGRELVDRLCQGDHPVKVSVRPNQTAANFKERIDMGHVHIEFTDSIGGTDVGVRLDPAAIDLSGADFEAEQGTVHLEGTLTLNYVPVRCVADINLATLQGQGHLVSLEPVASIAA